MTLAMLARGRRVPPARRHGAVAVIAVVAGLAAASLSAPPSFAQPTAAPVLEYSAHASFVVQSATGARVVIDPFNSERGLVELAGAESLSTNRLVLDRAALATTGRTLVLRPSPDVKAWSQPLADAWGLRDGARPAAGTPPDRDAARRNLDALRRAAALVPSVVVFQYELAEALVAGGRHQEALPILERALAATARQDVEYTTRARLLLADLYAGLGRHDLATAQFRIVAAGSSRPAQVELATTFLKMHQGR